MCVCRCIKAIVSDSAFSVPPQQLITNDGGIIEIGAEVSTSPVVTCHVSRVTCHVKRVTCYVSRVMCHVSRCSTASPTWSSWSGRSPTTRTS